MDIFDNGTLDLPSFKRAGIGADDPDDSDFECEDDDSTPAINKAILKAAENGDNEQLTQLLTDNPAMVNCRDGDGYTPLHRSAYNGHRDCVWTLIQLGCDLDARTNDGWTPLHSAAKWAQCEVASLLISCGADINARTLSNATPLHLACEHAKKSRQIIELFLYNSKTDRDVMNDAGDTALAIATRTGPFCRLFDYV